MEIQQEVKVIQVDYECPECEVGKMRPTGVQLMSPPVKYPHKCTECGHTMTFRERKYPYITYELIN